MRVMTVNARYINDFDEYPWSSRKTVIKEMIEEYNPDLIGFQEIMDEHFNYLTSVFKDKYHFYGEYRDFIFPSEMNLIFIKKDRFEVLSSNTIWLSETPNKKFSIGWDSSLARVLSYVKLKDLSNGSTLYHLNTHFDYAGEKARINSAKMTLDLIKDLNETVVLTGDFNSTPTHGFINLLLESNILDNSYNHFKDKKNSLTIHNFTDEIKGEPIDYIFASKNLKIVNSEIIRYKKDGIFSSDHYHILVDFE
nr:endonuclease/exonuclease/phosphatase family protein [Helcococcus sueciensis]